MAVHPAASSPVTMAAQSVAPTSGALTAHPAASNTLVTAAAHGAAQGAGDAGSAAGVGRARLRLSFSADSWVEVRDAAGKRLFAGQGRANSVRTIAGSAPMKVYLGFASGVQVQLNHHVVAIGPQFLAGDAARFEAGADGVLRRDAHDSTAGNSHPRG
jgi:cytoskeleton protein RodZ